VSCLGGGLRLFAGSSTGGGGGGGGTGVNALLPQIEKGLGVSSGAIAENCVTGLSSGNVVLSCACALLLLARLARTSGLCRDLDLSVLRLMFGSGCLDLRIGAAGEGDGCLTGSGGGTTNVGGGCGKDLGVVPGSVALISRMMGPGVTGHGQGCWIPGNIAI
jgi:hypothetical protein